MQNAQVGEAARSAEFILVYGASGWIGSQMVEILKQHKELKQQGVQIISASSRLENFSSVLSEFKEYHKPPHSKVIRVINCAGKTGRPNVDWCETHKHETLQANLMGAIHLASICDMHNVHLTHFGTGCMYTYNDKFPQPPHEYSASSDHPAVKESDPITFTGSFYSKTKATAEEYIKEYPACLILRIRMPISDDLHPRSLLTKLLKYEKVVNIPNSMSILHDLLPIAVEMSFRGLSGVYNFTNPGYITHNQLLSKYKQYIDPTFTWKNFTEEEQNQILLAPRSNTFLDTSKLETLFPSLLPIDHSLDLLFSRMKVIQDEQARNK